MIRADDGEDEAITVPLEAFRRGPYAGGPAMRPRQLANARLMAFIDEFSRYFSFLNTPHARCIQP
jgi:hypothetical protein